MNLMRAAAITYRPFILGSEGPPQRRSYHVGYGRLHPPTSPHIEGVRGITGPLRAKVTPLVERHLPLSLIRLLSIIIDERQ